MRQPMKILPKLTLVLFSCFLSALPVQSQTWDGVEYLGNQNLYSTVGYSDCWGYTAPDGREYALLGVRSGVSIIDITGAPTLKEIAFIPNPAGESDAMSIKTYRHYAYVANDDGGGINIVDLSLLPTSASLARTYIDLNRSHALYIDTTDALLYAQHDGDKGIIVFSLADPLQPAVVDSFGLHCHNIYARDKRAYISEGVAGTFAIYDVSAFPHPPLLKRTPLPPDGGFAHSAWVTEDGNYLLASYETAHRTAKLWSINDADSVYVAGEYIGPTAFPHHVYIKGHYAYFAHYLDGLRIVNISSPFDLSEVAFFDSYGPSGSGYHGAWGAFPFFPSGKIILSDIETGLYVVRFLPPIASIGKKGPAHEFVLHQNHPNPFNPETVVRYQLSVISEVRLSVFDVLGREVAVLVDREEGPGSHDVQWDATTMPSGVYYYRLVAGERIETKRMLFIR